MIRHAGIFLSLIKDSTLCWPKPTQGKVGKGPGRVLFVLGNLRASPSLRCHHLTHTWDRDEAGTGMGPDRG